MGFLSNTSPFWFFILFTNCHSVRSNVPHLQPDIVEAWVTKLGTELYHFGDVVTRRNKMQENFKDAKVETREGSKLVQDIAREIKNMMELKISAVKLRSSLWVVNIKEEAEAKNSVGVSIIMKKFKVQAEAKLILHWANEIGKKDEEGGHKKLKKLS